jgi:cytochrome c556
MLGDVKYLVFVAVVACSHPVQPTAPKRRAGDLMIEVGMRFERSRRAVLANAWELAAYDLHELREVFDDDLLPGKWSDNPAMQHDAHQFTAGALAQLEAAARVHDRAAWDTAYPATVQACNACHATAHVAFLAIDSSGALRLSPP